MVKCSNECKSGGCSRSGRLEATQTDRGTKAPFADFGASMRICSDTRWPLCRLERPLHLAAGKWSNAYL